MRQIGSACRFFTLFHFLFSPYFFAMDTRCTLSGCKDIIILERLYMTRYTWHDRRSTRKTTMGQFHQPSYEYDAKCGYDYVCHPTRNVQHELQRRSLIELTSPERRMS